MIEAAYTVGFFKCVWQLCELNGLGVIRSGVALLQASILLGSNPKKNQYHIHDDMFQARGR